MDKKSQKVTKKQSDMSKSSVIYRNPFLNFLQDFRKKNIGLTSQEVMQKAAEMWRKMSENEKAPYYEMAKNAPKRKKRKSGRKRRRARRARSYSSQRSTSSSRD
ncbi:HMG box and/or DUF1074 domain containing protein [Asbolus verrucosus]|uniref:HMG box and/or DUF1074 domain containing protein n=1 Tax=Asbolus verrucosus TaxID=1661398 RepID=A0A482V8Z3_ASBVE|nr:HMG box and/or DUF1074 domain containing protein [Asbolus verrucosus]